MAARTAEVWWALRCAHQVLSARCQGLHFMINILKGAFSSTDPSPGFLGVESWRQEARQLELGVRRGRVVRLGIPRLLPTPVSTSRFQEMGRERKRALMKNPLVKNVFL